VPHSGEKNHGIGGKENRYEGTSKKKRRGGGRWGQRKTKIHLGVISLGEKEKKKNGYAKKNSCLMLKKVAEDERGERGGGMNSEGRRA